MDQRATYTRKTTSSEGTKQLAQTLAPYVKPGDVIVLNGDLGAGKTQFVQGLATAMGVQNAVTSPTFNIMVAYEEGSLPIYHFDLYRLEEESQLEDIGYYDLIDGPGLSLVEWGEKFPRAMPYEYIEIEIRVNEDDLRIIRVRGIGERARSLLCVWSKDSKSRLIQVG